MGNHVVLFGLLVLALIGLGLASNEPNVVEDGSAAVNEPNNVNSYSDLFGPYSTVFSDYLASVSFLFSLPFSSNINDNILVMEGIPNVGYKSAKSSAGRAAVLPH